MSLETLFGPPWGAPVIHRVLLLGLFITLGAFTILVFGVTGPLLTVTPMFGYLVAFPAVSMVVMAATILRARVPRRRPDQPVAEYWAEPANSGLAAMVWVAIESGGMMGLVGWLLSGSLVALAAALVALGALIVLSPAQLAGR